jgi:hypothetical protein
MIADSFNNCSSSGISHTETFSNDAADEEFTGSRSITNDISGDDILMRIKGRTLIWTEDDATARNSLTDIVVGITE